MSTTSNNRHDATTLGVSYKDHARARQNEQDAPGDHHTPQERVFGTSPLAMSRPTSQEWPAVVPIVTLQHRDVVAQMANRCALVGDARFIEPDRVLPAAIARMLLATRAIDYQGGHPLWCWIDDGRQVCNVRCTTPGCRGLHVPPGLVAIRAVVPCWRGVAVAPNELSKSASFPGDPFAAASNPSTLYRNEPFRLYSSLPVEMSPAGPPGVPTEFITETVHLREVVDIVESLPPAHLGEWYRFAKVRGMPAHAVTRQQDWHAQRINRAHACPPAPPVAPEAQRSLVEALNDFRFEIGWRSDLRLNTQIKKQADSVACLALSVTGAIDLSKILRAIPGFEARVTVSALLSAPGLNPLSRLDWVRQSLRVEAVAAVEGPLASALLNASTDRGRATETLHSRAAQLAESDRRRKMATKRNRERRIEVW
jgi:hypothetical protein